MKINIIILTFFIPFIYSDDTNIYKTNLNENDMFGKYYQKAREILKSMSPNEKIAQMFFLRYNYQKVVEQINTKNNFGGYVLFSEDFVNHDKNSIKKELEKIQNALKIKLGLSVDEEGGKVVRISKYSKFRNEQFKSSQEYYKEGGIPKILEIEKEKRNLIKDLNLNINLAPVADYSSNSSSYIYNRTLGQNLSETEKYIGEVVKAANNDNFITCLKHFPGYGSNEDTHGKLVYDKREKSEFEETDFKPFIAGIKENVPMIMVSHNIIEKIDSKYPSSISAKIHKILREELNYTGIIITDDISMGAITQFVNQQSIGTIAILSGVDIIISSNQTQNYEEVVNDYENNLIDDEQIDNAVTRILAWKLMYMGNIINSNIVSINDSSSSFFTYFIIFIILALVVFSVYYFFLRKPKVSGQSASDLIAKL